MNSNEKKLLNFLLKEECFAFGIISKYYPLTESLIDKINKHAPYGSLVWHYVSKNKAIEWSYKFIKKYENYLDWGELSKNRYWPWSVALIEKFETKWNWPILSSNKHIIWSAEIINKFVYFLNWGKSGLSSNSSLPWSFEFIDKYLKKWDWESLCMNEGIKWDIRLIEKYKEKINWEKLSGNKSLQWSIGILDRFFDNWDWQNLSVNEALPWTLEFIEKYEGKWNWDSLSSNISLPWSFELIDKFENKWKWKDVFLVSSLSENTALPWSIDLIEKYENKWDWKRLSENESLVWSIPLIERFEDKWDWHYLSANEALPWSLFLIEKFENKWDWYYLSANEVLPWTSLFINKYQEKIYWGCMEKNYREEPYELYIKKYDEEFEIYGDFRFRFSLSNNRTVDWSIDLIEKNKEKLFWPDLIGNPAVYEKIIMPHLTDSVIEAIINVPFYFDDDFEKSSNETSNDDIERSKNDCINIINILAMLKADKEFQKWAIDRTWFDIFTLCPKGEWLLWLFQKTNPDDIQLLTLAKAHCANTIKTLVSNEENRNRIDLAIKFGEGKAKLNEINTAATESTVLVNYYSSEFDEIKKRHDASIDLMMENEQLRESEYESVTIDHRNNSFEINFLNYCIANTIRISVDLDASAGLTAYYSSQSVYEFINIYGPFEGSEKISSDILFRFGHFPTMYLNYVNCSNRAQVNDIPEIGQMHNQIETAEICRTFLPFELWNLSIKNFEFLLPQKKENIFIKSEENLKCLLEFYFDRFGINKEGAIAFLLNKTSLSLNQVEYIIKKLSESYELIFEDVFQPTTVIKLLQSGFDAFTLKKFQGQGTPSCKAKALKFLEYVINSESLQADSSIPLSERRC